jgi:hypothetical protein
MKNLIHTLFLLSIGVTLTACKKVNTCISREKTDFISDTIIPHSYYPNYPGSFWEYDDGVVESIPIYYARDKIFKLEEFRDSCVFEANKSIVGINMGSYFHVGNNRYDNYDLSFFGAKKFYGKTVDTVVGNSIYYDYHYSTFDSGWSTSINKGRVEEYIPLLVVQGVSYNNVYRIRCTLITDGKYGGFETRTDKYYAENVGLIVQEKLDDVLEPAYRRELVDYFINY